AQPAPVTVTAPPVATSPTGKLSVRPGFASASAWVFGLVMTNESVAFVFGGTAVGLNDLATVTFEKSEADAAAALLMPCVLVRAPEGRVFVYVPLAVMVTFTVI